MKCTPNLPVDYHRQCGDCNFCKNPKTNLCQKIRSTQGAGVMPDGTSRLSCNGKQLYHYMGCSTFAEYSVVADISVVKIRDDAPLNKICLLACGITTGLGELALISNSPVYRTFRLLVTYIFGLGAVRYTCKVEVGSTVAVWGLGCVGLAAIAAAKERGASKIIGVDINPGKFEQARFFGATDCVNPKDLPAEDTAVQKKIVEMTNGGVDYSFECVGSVKTMRQALEACHKVCWTVEIRWVRFANSDSCVPCVGMGNELYYWCRWCRSRDFDTTISACNR